MHLLIPIAANAVLAIVLMVLFLWRRTVDDARLADGEDALRLYRERFPDATGMATVTADRQGALITLGLGAGIGLLQRRGRRWTARRLGAGDIRSVALTGGDTLSLSLADFGWPRAHLPIADPDDRAAWLARLGSLATAGAARTATVSTHA